jgi:thimet oligopeptidase
MARVLFVAAALLCLPASAHSQELELRFDRVTPEQLEPFVRRILDSASRSLETLLAQKALRTVANTLRPYDDYRLVINRARVVSLLSDVHPDSTVRAAAGRAEILLEQFQEKRRADRRIYDMLRAVDTAGAEAEVKFWLNRELDIFRRESVNRDSTTRARVAAIQRELDRLGRLWDENPRRDTTVAFDSVDLEGMTAPWIAAHRRDAQGRILIGAEEMRPILNQAKRPATRQRAMAITMRLRPNHFVLDTMLHHRYAMARLLGYRNWADYQLSSSMAGSPEGARKFLDEVRRLSAQRIRRTVEARLSSGGEGKRDAVFLYDLFGGDDENASGPGPSGGVGAALRPYLPYDRVRDGIFALVKDLLDLEFKPAPDLPVWDPTVEPFRVFENGRLVANVYLDLHWKPGRSPIGASASAFRSGVRDKTLLEAALIGGMVRALPGEPALLGPRPMETMFHEFGHLLHYIFSIRPWFATSGLPGDFDFREVPSNLFAQWAQDPDVVARFARHYQTGEPPARELLERLPTAAVSASFMAQFLSRMSLEVHDRPPGDMHGAIREAFQQTIPPGLPYKIKLPEGDLHPEITLPHLGNGYDAAYYTYLWSRAIAQDILTKFEHGLLDREMVQAYKKHILEPGRSKSAKELVESFLGRPFSLDAFAKSIGGPP